MYTHTRTSYILEGRGTLAAVYDMVCSIGKKEEGKGILTAA